jgi:hypothetical protein
MSMRTSLRDASHSQVFLSEDAALNVLKSTASLLAQLAVCTNGKTFFVAGPIDPVKNMIDMWLKLDILGNEQYANLQAKVEQASTSTWDDLQRTMISYEAQAILDEQRRREEETKWVLPTQHHLPHDPTAPWHELPAANALYQKRTQGYPLRANMLPQGGYSLRNGGKLADDELRRDVEEMHREALRCFDKYTNAEEVHDVDALGNVVWKDRLTRNHYGFTYEGIARRAANGVDDY